MHCAFSKRGQTVSVILDRDTAGLFRLTVTDEGPGVSDTLLPSLFQPFVQGGDSQGYGLGLAIAERASHHRPWRHHLRPQQERAAAFASSFASRPPRLKTRQFWKDDHEAHLFCFQGLSVSHAGLLASGCATPNPTALDHPADVPVAFTAPVVDKAAPIWPETNWWVNFKADELPALEETAQKENLDIAAANARILEAEAADESAFAGLLPTVSGSAGVSRNGTNRSHSATSTANSFSASLTGTYGVDLFGLNQDRLIARRARTCAAPRYE